MWGRGGGEGGRDMVACVLRSAGSVRYIVIEFSTFHGDQSSETFIVSKQNFSFQYLTFTFICKAQTYDHFQMRNCIMKLIA